LPELRYDILSGDFAVIAVERTKRPSDFKKAQKGETHVPKRDPKCPFCPGNESMTPPEVYGLRKEGHENSPGWRIRVVPNKFPALVSTKVLSDTELEAFSAALCHLPETDDMAMYWNIPGVGAHEVVIESPLHDGTLGTYEFSQMVAILNTLKERVLVLYDLKEIKYVQVFRNWGPQAGASLYHPHFQIIGLPLLPPKVDAEIKRHKQYEAKTGRCLLCDVIEREVEKDLRIVKKSDEFIILCPFASKYSFETIIVPRKHSLAFAEIGSEKMRDLARQMVWLFSRYEELFSSLSYNIVFHSAPKFLRGRKQTNYHWHIHVYPRLTTQAGLELGTNVYINPTPPEFATQQFLGKGEKKHA